MPTLCLPLISPRRPGDDVELLLDTPRVTPQAELTTVGFPFSMPFFLAEAQGDTEAPGGVVQDPPAAEAQPFGLRTAQPFAHDNGLVAEPSMKGGGGGGGYSTSVISTTYYTTQGWDTSMDCSND